MDVARFQSNEKPWSGNVLPTDYEPEWRKRLRLMKGPFHIKRQGEPAGPARSRAEAIDRVVEEMLHAKPGFQIAIQNENDKVVRARILESDNPFGPIFPTVGPCRDDYPNIKTIHNGAGQLVKGQEPMLLAYQEAERINGKPITITGMGWRSCSSQYALYASDPGRFAHPATSRHCRGLALDIYYSSANLTSKARSALISVGFNFAVSGEPWHASYVESG